MSTPWINKVTLPYLTLLFDKSYSLKNNKASFFCIKIRSKELRNETITWNYVMCRLN
jgi:hypothetical protein